MNKIDTTGWKDWDRIILYRWIIGKEEKNMIEGTVLENILR